jgi:exodeoxyribonuclease V alpha subunit
MAKTSSKTPAIIGKLTFLKSIPSGWSFGTFEAENGLSFSVVGTALTGLKTHTPYEFTGDWGLYKGETQLKVVSAIPHVKANEASLSRYLMDQYKGLGQKTVKDLVSRWQGQGRTLEELSQWAIYEPHQLEEWANTESGLSRHLFYREAKNGVLPEEDLVRRALQLRYKANTANEVLVTDAVIKKLARHLLGLKQEGALSAEDKPRRTPGEAMASFQDDPFAPMFDVDGYGFKAADKVWASMGRARLDPIRVGALGWDIIKNACEGAGHTFLTDRNFMRALAVYDQDLDLDFVVTSMAERKAPVVVEAGRYYIKKLWFAEKSTAERIKERLAPAEPLIQKSRGEILNQIHTLEASRGMTLDKQQRDALLGIATSTSRIHTVTAMPGCGKTAIMEFLAQLVHRDGLELATQGKVGHTMAFMAPTGKAAKVLNERVKALSLEAKTVHATIGWGNPMGELTPIKESVVVVDESSMMDLELTDDFLSQVGNDAHVIFIGDTDQLASVGPGNVLHDLLKLPLDHHRLEVVHRNTGDILKLVKSIKEGRYEKVHGQDVMTYGLPDPEKDMDRVLTSYVNACKAHPQGAKRVGMLTGLRKGDINKPGWNVTYLNRALQDRMNPDGERVMGYSLRLNDRIIIKKNQKYEVEHKDKEGKPTVALEYIANGDTGVLKDVKRNVDGKIEKVVLDLDDGRLLSLPSDVMETLAHGWALTIHQSQGSEYSTVMMFAQNGHATLFNRKLLYTGVSRAKEKLNLFANGDTLRALISRPGDHRHSMLAERVLGQTQEPEDVLADEIPADWLDVPVMAETSGPAAPSLGKSNRPRF